MDVAVFVGFTASGPLQTPVAVESEAQFAAIFGQDAPLAWDVERGEQAYAHLAPAVRAFFRNHGLRCWVIRVARQRVSDGKAQKDLNFARSNYFPIPGLARAEFDGEKLKRITPAFARARSEGSWSDPLRVGSALLSSSIQVNSVKTPPDDSGNYQLNINRPTPQNIAAGDLLRMTFSDSLGNDRYVLFLPVAKVEQGKQSPPSTPGATIDVTGRKAVWFEVLSSNSLPAPGSPVKVAVFTREADALSSDEHDVISGFESRPPYEGTLNPHLTNPPMAGAPSIQDGDSQTVMLKLSNCTALDTPARGSVMQIDLGTGALWMTVEELAFSAGESGSAFVWGKAFKQSGLPSDVQGIPVCEVLTFEIWVRKAEEYSVSLSDLGLVAAHGRYWAGLPSDEEVYRDPDPAATETPATILWRQVGDLFRFPLAGIHTPGEFYFPLTMPAVAEDFLGPVMLQGTELERDGLAKFDADLFIDPDLIDVKTEDLANEAEYLLYLSPRPRRLSAVHAAFALEEATIVAVPDAVHRGWVRRDSKALIEPGLSSPPTRPEWWHFIDCNPPRKQPPPLSDCDPKPAPPSPIKPVSEPEWGNFLSCAIRIIEPPPLFGFPKISTDGTFTLSWGSSPPLQAQFELQESGTPDFDDAPPIYSGPLTSCTLYGRKGGDYYYRVRAIINENTSNWSNGVAVRVETNARWALEEKKGYSAAPLLAVQRALLRMCAARGDLFAVLSLPEHYREDNAIEHVMLLKATPDLASPTQGVSPLGFGEANAFSYGAVFHPWLIEREELQGEALIRMPPCGAVAGVFADRALQRGAWLAPANQPLRGVVSLEPVLDPGRRLDLQEARVNLLRQEPRGFVVLDADTLSGEVDLRPINVRRLLILLRRQALRLGAIYVFEPNSPAFRRMVDRGFTEMLDGMFERGAFAGATPSSSYQVVTDDSLNTPESVDQGRFIVELRVAPSLPMTFVTIRLVQTSERSLATEVR
jgi:hypothetical protein